MAGWGGLLQSVVYFYFFFANRFKIDGKIPDWVTVGGPGFI